MFKRTTITAIASLALFVANAKAATAAEPTKDEASAVTTEAAPTNNKPVSIAFLVGHGDKDAFKGGIGGRIGYTLANKLYLGGSFTSHFGTREGAVQSNVWYAGGEVGYELDAGPFVIRPYAGAGIASVFASVYIPEAGAFQGGRFSATERRFVFWPGASLLLPFDGGRVFVGVDAKLLVVDKANAFNAYATLGVAF